MKEDHDDPENTAYDDEYTWVAHTKDRPGRWERKRDRREFSVLPPSGEKTFAEKLREAVKRQSGMPGEEAAPLKTEKALAEKTAKAPIAGGVLQLFPRAMYHLALTSKAGADKYGTTVSTIKFLDTPGAYELHTDAMIRHVVDEKLEGPVSHKDGGLLHPVMVAWNALARLEVFLKNAEKPDAE